MKHIFSFFFFFIFSLILFLPKVNLYYMAEKALASAHLYLNDEIFSNRLIYLDVENATLLLDTTRIGSIEKIRLVPFVIFNNINITNVKFSGEFASLFPDGIDNIALTYTFFHPLNIDVQGVGGFGPVHGNIDLSEHHLTLIFEPTQTMRQYPLLLAKLRKSDKGLVYETSF
ncbi:MAG: hypothetical protein PHO27_10230 [Sulfuricurvum sp.]|nr:hypothetical protein [Sulfuricurvum sp.]